MYKQLKQELKEIIEIVNECPDELKTKCFEILLENYLSSSVKLDVKPKEAPISELTSSSEKRIELDIGSQDAKSEDISLNEFHVKSKKFLAQSDIDVNCINEVYYKEDGKLMPLYESVKSTKMSECQIRLALLTAFENSFSDISGTMSFNGEQVRKRCQDMKCYDQTNFSTHLKNNAYLFVECPDKYYKDFIYELSPDGKKELAIVLHDLAKGD